MNTPTPGPAGAAHCPPADPGLHSPVPLGGQLGIADRCTAYAELALGRLLAQLREPGQAPTQPDDRHALDQALDSAGFHLMRARQEFLKAAYVPMTRPAPQPGNEPTPGSTTVAAPTGGASAAGPPAGGAGDNAAGRHRREQPVPPRWPLPR